MKFNIRQIGLVTTAAYPWLTGTTINPLMRAAFLALKGFSVTLYIPWLSPIDQKKVFPGDILFDTPELQTREIYRYLESVGVMHNLVFDSCRYTKTEKPSQSRNIAIHPKWRSAYKISGWI